MSEITKVAIIARCSALCRLSGQDQLDLAARAVERHFPAGSFLFRAGEPAAMIYLLASGRVKASRQSTVGQESTTQVFSPGDLCGWQCALKGGFYCENARAIGQVSALAWTAVEFEVDLARMPEMSRGLLDRAAHGLREQEQRYLELAHDRVPQRLARELLRLSRAVKSHSGVELDVPLNREELAHLTGTSLFTVSRLLNLWQQQGLVRPGRGHVAINDSRGLDRIAEGWVRTPNRLARNPQS